MPRLLKQSTAVTFRIGPFVDSTDGVTAETGLSIGQADIQISKAGGAFAQTSAASPTTTHDADGWYQCPLTATDTGTLGMLTVQIVMAGALPVWEHFEVVAANIYDSVISGTDLVDVNVAQWNGSAVATPTIAGVPEVDITHIAGSAVSTSAAQLGVNVVNIEGSDATDQINAACDAAIETYNLHYILHTALPTNWVTNITANSALDYMADDGTAVYDRTTDSLQAIADSGGGGPTAAQIADAVWDEAQADHVGAGTFGETATEIASILADTGTDGVAIADNSITAAKIATGAIDADALAADAGTEIGTAVWATATRTLTANTNLNDPTAAAIADAVWDEVINASTHNVGSSAGQRLRQLSSAVVTEGTATAGAATSITLAVGSSAIDNYYNFDVISIVDGTGAGQSRLIVAYNGTTRVATVYRAWATNPDATSEYVIQAKTELLIRNSGLAQAGAANSITLATTASGIDDEYVGSSVLILAGTGEGQLRVITAYNGTSKAASITDAWAANPDTTSVYAVLPLGRSYVVDIDADSLTKITGDIDSNSTQLAALVADNPNRPTKNVAFSNFSFLMVDATDFATPETGLTVSGEISKDGAAFGALTNAITEIANGMYKVNLTQTEMNADVISLRFTATGAADRLITVYTQPT